jgi:hypothetical protein
VTLVVRVNTVLKWIAVTGAKENVPHRQGSVNYRNSGEERQRQGSAQIHKKKRFAGCMDEQ